VVTSPDSVIEDFSFLNVDQPEEKVNTISDYAPINLKKEVEEYEKQIIKKYMGKYGSLRKTARYLGSSQTTIWRKATQYGIKIQEREA